MKIFNKYLIFGFFALFLLLILPACSLNKKSFDVNENYNPIIEDLNGNQEDENLIGGDTDEHGCLIAAGYSWCEAKQKCLRTWEEECVVVNQSSDAQPSKNYESISDSVVWQSYHNEKFNYSVSYPDIANVSGEDLSQRVEFVGPLSEGEWWPRISIAHYDSQFYHPPKGTDVGEWVKMFPDYKLGKARVIAGLPALHFIQQRTQQAYGADYYYFIKEDQLFQITLLHTLGREDWPLYDKFLDSFKFDQEDIVNSCQTDSDCVPLPGCHPRECINSQYASNYPQPEVCTELFDCQAAYKAEDCLCQNFICVNDNLGKSCQE